MHNKSIEYRVISIDNNTGINCSNFKCYNLNGNFTHVQSVINQLIAKKKKENLMKEFFFIIQTLLRINSGMFHKFPMFNIHDFFQLGVSGIDPGFH